MNARAFGHQSAPFDVHIHNTLKPYNITKAIYICSMKHDMHGDNCSYIFVV